MVQLLAARWGSNLFSSGWAPSLDENPLELPCDFSAFVAGRRELSVGEAEQLIGQWLETYEPSVSSRRAAQRAPLDDGTCLPESGSQAPA